jgi:NAD(P)-dependent dehydrogenase (short-subunit alcohol dehydrogenase family)
MALNADAVFYLFRAASRVMIPQGSGSLIAISSVSSIRTSTSLHYSAAKGAVNAMVVNLSVPLGKHGIRINAILPGPIDTRALREHMTTPEIEARFAANVPLGRIGTPAEIAGLAAFLASEDSSFVTGQLISANGGMAQRA